MEHVYLSSPQGFWCGWVEDKALSTLRGGHGRPIFHAAEVFGSTEEAQDQLALLRQIRLDEGYQEKEAPPVAPSALLRDPDVAARQEYFLAYTPTKGISVEDIEAVSLELVEFFMEREVFVATGIRCHKAAHGYLPFSLAREVDTLALGHVPGAMWDGIPTDRQRLIMTGNQGVNGFLNPKGRGSCAVYTGKRMADFAMRLFITRLQARLGAESIVVSDQQSTVYKDSLFDVDVVKDAEWYPVYQDVLFAALADRGWVKLTPDQAFARAAKKGAISSPLAWG